MRNTKIMLSVLLLVFCFVPTVVDAQVIEIDGEQETLTIDAAADEFDETFEEEVKEDSAPIEAGEEQMVSTKNAFAPKANSTAVNTAELKAVLTSAVDGDVVTLADGFDMSVAQTITLPANVNVTIDGKGQTMFNSGTLLFTGGANGSVTLKNMQLSGGSSIAFVFNGSGTAIVDNVNISNRSVTAADGAAVNTNGAGNLTIRNCTFENNETNGGNQHGYSGGAIGVKSNNDNGTNKDIIIVNSVFKGNETINTNSISSGVQIGGQGGAIYLRRISGNVVIRDCYFDNNAAAKDISLKPTQNQSIADGGAIGVNELLLGGKITIDSSTFNGNIAGDDGGAIMIMGNIGSGDGTLSDAVKIVNSTFYNNQALSAGGSTHNGGAIQFYMNGSGRTKRTMEATLENNTFVGNSAVGQGGAVAGTGATSLSGNKAKGFYKNNLFVGNFSNKGTKYNNVSHGGGSSTVVNNNGNIGLDNGTASSITMEDVFGKYTIALSGIYGGKTAGDLNHRVSVPTFVIAPGGKADGVATTTDILFDQRGYVRPITAGDVGSTEIAWVQYNANAGEMTWSALTSYDGTKYYEVDSAGKTEQYYSVGFIDKIETVKTDAALNLTRDGYDFLGWSTDSSATIADSAYAEGQNITYAANGLKLYAVWKENIPETFTVTYDANGAISGTVPSDINEYESGDIVTILGKSTLAYDGYDFIGWNTKADGSGISYAVGNTFAITADTTLYAVWEENVSEKFTVTYDANGAASGKVPSDVKEYESGEIVTILGKSTLAYDGYDFIGWNTKADGSGVSYKVGDAFNITSNVTLYAQWNASEILGEIIENDNNNVETGDQSNKFLYITLAALALGVIISRRNDNIFQD